jgi:hypothetical protein
MIKSADDIAIVRGTIMYHVSPLGIVEQKTVVDLNDVEITFRDNTTVSALDTSSMLMSAALADELSVSRIEALEEI